MKILSFIFQWIGFQYWELRKRLSRGDWTIARGKREKDDLVESSQKFWSKKLGKKISEDEAYEITLNMKNFLTFLMSVKKGD